MRTKTRYRLKKGKQDAAINDRFEVLMQLPGAMASAVAEQVMLEFKITWSTVWRVRNRVKERSQKEKQSTQSVNG